MTDTGLSIKRIRRIDKSSMLETLLDFPEQCLAASDIARKSDLLVGPNDFNKIVFAGLGGSAAGGDVVRSCLYSESKLPILVFREYDMPRFLDEKTLTFVCSYSGNTEETLSAYKQAKEASSRIIAISSGGKLKEHCLNDKVTFVNIPSGMPPRCALGYLSIIPLRILERLKLIGSLDEDIKEVNSVLKNLKDKCLNPCVGTKDNIAKYAAAKIYNKFAVVYAASLHFDVVAMRFRAQLNENSKALASSHVFPEMNHNEIVGWQNPARLFKNFVVVLFTDKDIHPQVKKRMQLTSEMLKGDGVQVLEIHSRGSSILSRIFSSVYIGDFISFYLAIRYGIDPTPVDRITYLKKRLSEL